MCEESASFGPNTMQEGIAEDGFSQTVPNCTPSFSMEELSYHQNRPQEEEAAAMEIELQQHLGLDMEHYYNTAINNLTDAYLRQDTSFSHNHHHQGSNNSSLNDNPYPPTPDFLNLFHLPMCPPSSLLPNFSLSLVNPTQMSANFLASLGFLGDFPATDISCASKVVCDPLFHLNQLPPQPPLVRELFQSLGHGYNLSASRTGSLFGGVDDHEREAIGALYQDHGEGRHFDNGVLEFTRDMNCVAKGRKGKGTTKHFPTEKQRREQLNDKYKVLRSLVPNPTKTDTASVVGVATEYIKELLRTVKELEILVEKKRCGRGRSKRHKTEDGVESSNMKPDPDQSSYNGSSSLRNSWLQRKSKDTEIDVRIVDDEVTIKLSQHKKINCLLLPVSKVLYELQLEIHHVAGGLVGDNHSFLFNSKICEGSSVYASAIVNKLVEVVEKQ